MITKEGRRCLEQLDESWKELVQQIHVIRYGTPAEEEPKPAGEKPTPAETEPVPFE